MIDIDPMALPPHIKVVTVCLGVKTAQRLRKLGQWGRNAGQGSAALRGDCLHVYVPVAVPGPSWGLRLRSVAGE
jgi:hypothetical protein